MKNEFKCKYCYYTTSSIDDLREHMKRVHGIDNPLENDYYVKVNSPEIEVGLTIYFTKMINAPVKFILDSYDAKHDIYTLFMSIPKFMSFEQIEAFIELRELFDKIDTASIFKSRNYITYPNGHTDVVYIVQIKGGTLKKILNSV